MSSIIKVENLSKKYRIRHRGGGDFAYYKTFREELINTIKKPIYYLTGGKKTKEDIWVLRDISFNVEPGEILGLIGPNGAGKTTLLKVLTRITPPTKGKAIINGRVSSLLEVGTGFHPELTGRENVYLNGAVLGMRKKEIDRKFDRIVEFAGIEKFLDTPVKRYSSGMSVRLAFSVAAHLEPDILLVDEVLSVGDAAFQKKSLGKMEEITKQGNRTIVFVSHNMDAINDLCSKVILLDKGRIKYIGDTKSAINKYLSIQKHSSKPYKEYVVKPNLTAQIRSIRLKNRTGKNCNHFYTNEKAIVEVCFEVRESLRGYETSVCIFRNTTPIWLSSDTDSNISLLTKREKGIYKKQVELPINFLKPGVYQISASISVSMGGIRTKAIDQQFNNGLKFTLILPNKNLLNTTLHPEKIGFLAVPKKWEDVY